MVLLPVPLWLCCLRRLRWTTNLAPKWKAGRKTLAWWIDQKTHFLFHTGDTKGYESFARFNPVQDWAVIVLYNRCDPFVDFLGRVSENVSASVSGKPATPLDFMCEADKRGLARLGIQ